MNTHTLKLGLMLMALCAGAPAAVFAQCTATGPGRPWLPRGEAAFETPPAADRSIIAPNLIAAEAIVKKTSFAVTHGFDLRPMWNPGYDASHSRDHLGRYMVSFEAFCPSASADGDGTMPLAIIFNPNLDDFTEHAAPAVTDAHGDRLFLERERSETRFGATAVFGNYGDGLTAEKPMLVLFTAGGESPTLPVSREEYLRARILFVDGIDGQIKETSVKTSYEQWLERAPARKKEHEEMVATVARIDPSQAAKVRADLEKGERDTAESMKKMDAIEREGIRKVTSLNSSTAANLRAQLAAMTPQERASPAFAAGDELRPAGSPNATAVIRANPAFYRTRRSPFEPRAVLVHLEYGYSALSPQKRAMYEMLDWAAIKRLVNEKP